MELLNLVVAAEEFAGLAPTNTLDQTASASGTNASPSSGFAGTTSQASELLIGSIGGSNSPGSWGPSFTAGAGFTAIPTVTNALTGLNAEYQIVSATGTYQANGAFGSAPNSGWDADISTFKGAAATGPSVTATSGNSAYTEGGSPVAVDPGVTVSDLSSTTLASATVSITGNFQTGDTLAFTNTSSTTFGNITPSYNSATGVLTLTSSGATATLAQWQAALESTTFSTTASSVLTRTVSFTVNDGTNSSSPATRDVTVTAPPVVTTSSGNAAYIEGGTPVVVNSGVTVSDPSSTTLASATVSITGNFQSGDTLAFTNTSSTTFGNIAASYNSATGVLTLTSSGATATLAQWQAALQSTTFSSTASNIATRTVSFTVNDGTNASNTATRDVTVTAVPVVTTSSGSASYTDGGSPVAVDPGITVSDQSSTTLAGASVSISGNFQSGDALSFTNTGTITGSYNPGTGVLTLTGTDTLANYQTALQSITFSTTSSSILTRTVSFTVNDGTNSSTPATRNVTVTEVPVVTTSSGSASYTQGGSAVAVDPAVTVSDASSTTLASATVSITGNFQTGDTLAFTNTSSTTFGNITASYNSAIGVLTLTSSGATATLAQWQAALQSTTFSSTASSIATRTVSFTVNDGTNSSNTATRDVAVTAIPVVTTSSGSASYTDGGSPVAVDPAITVSDQSSTTLTGATVSVTNNFQSGDALNFTNTTNITGSYNAGTGVLTLTGTDTLADYQTALQSIAFSTTASSLATRTVSFTVNDGTNASSPATRDLTITAGPSVALSESGSPIAENGGTATITATLSASSSQPVTVYFSFGGTAVNGTDYSPSATSVTVAAGQTTGSITLTGLSNASFGSSSKTVIVSLGSITNGSAGSPNAVTATINPQPPTPTPATWINSVYLHLLNRPADPGGLAYWTGVLNSLGNTVAGRTQVVADIENSPEYRFDEVNALYIQYLHRSAVGDPGAQTWVNELADGFSIEQVAAQLASSPEFIQGQTNGSIGSWLNAFYLDALHRPVDAGGLNYWSDVSALGANRQQIAWDIFNAGPLPGLPSNEYRMDLVDQFYSQYLGRSAQADPGSLAWMAQLQQGVPDQAVIAGILGSTEFYDDSV